MVLFESARIAGTVPQAGLVVCSRTGNKLYSLGEMWRTFRKNAGISEAREEARQVPPHEHRRVAVVGLARDVDDVDILLSELNPRTTASMHRLEAAGLKTVTEAHGVRVLAR